MCGDFHICSDMMSCCPHAQGDVDQLLYTDNVLVCDDNVSGGAGGAGQGEVDLDHWAWLFLLWIPPAPDGSNQLAACVHVFRACLMLVCAYAGGGGAPLTSNVQNE